MLRHALLLVGFSLACLCVPPLRAQSLDLTSVTPSEIPAGSGMILVGGRPTQVGAGALTPAEAVALQQVLSTGRQSLVVGSDGAATGGSFFVNGSASGVNIPFGVTGIQNAANAPVMGVNGEFVNAGRYFAVSTDPGVTAATLAAAQIANLRGALLSSVLPVEGLPGVVGAIGRVDLNLISSSGILNEGVISSSGNLNISAPGTADIVLAGDGRYEALSGAINVRHAGFSEHADLTITGANFAANEVNLYSGTGNIRARLGEVSGPLSTYANYAHVGATTSTLRLGAIKIDGDPTFYNDAVDGDIIISGDIQVDEKLAIIASRDIITTATVSLIEAQDATGQGFDITMIAGANITTGSGPTTGIPPLGNEATASVTVDGASASGGDINLSATPSPFLTIRSSSTCTDCAAGNVTLAAFANGANGGHINTTNSYIFATGDGAGTNGTVLMLAGASSGLAIQTGAIVTANGISPSGEILLGTSQPTSSDSNPIVFDTNGSITSENFLTASSSGGSASVDLAGGPLFAGANLFVNAAGNLTAGTIQAQNIILSSSATLTLQADIAASGSIGLLAPNMVSLGFDVTSPRTLITSPAGQPLTMTFTDGAMIVGSLSSQVISEAGPLTMSGDFQFFYTTSLYSDTRVSVPAGSKVGGLQSIVMTTPELAISGSLEANGLVWNNPSASSRGTILNPEGSVVIPKNLVYNGQSLTILASGDILSAPGVTSIKLNSTTGNGGTLTMIAGFDFIDTGTSGLPVGSIEPVSGTGYTIVGPSATGGSILLPNVNIDVGSTSSNPDANDSGSILAAAHGGNSSIGFISLGNLSAKSTKGTGGLIRLYGSGGIQTGFINNSGAQGNFISLLAAETQLAGGAFTLDNGIMTGSGTFSGALLSASRGAGVSVRGPITTKGTQLSGGSIDIRSDASIDIKGNIDATGFRQNRIFQSYTGGFVSMLSSFGTITTGGINTSGISAESFLPNPISNPTRAGTAGPITILGANGITINGNVLANGGKIGTDDALAGYGGLVSLSTNTSPDAMIAGNIRVKGFLSAQGGQAPLGYGGLGGFVNIQSTTLQVLGSQGGVSINTTYGLGQFVAGSGQISISTNSTQPFPANFDLTSTKATIPLVPGAAFTIGTANPVNGTAGSIMARANSPGGTVVAGPVTKADLPNGILVSDTLSQDFVTIDAQNTSSFNPVVTGSTRRLQTPLESVAAFQTQRGDPEIMPTGGTISVGDQALPAKFTAFNLPDNFALNVTGFDPVLTLPTTAKFGGDITFSPILGAGLLTIDFGTGAGNIPATTSITGPTGVNSQIMLIANGASFNNRGVITSEFITFARTWTSPLTVNNIGPGAEFNGAAIVLAPQSSANVSFNFRAKGSTFDTPVQLANAALPTKYDGLALSYAKSVSKGSPINLTFGLIDPSGLAITPNVFAGTFGSVVSITSLPMTFNGDTAQTPLNFAGGPGLTSNTRMTITSAGPLTFADGTQLVATNDFAIKAPEIEIGGSTRLSAGRMKNTTPLTGIINSQDIISKGTLTITATGPGGISITGPNNLLLSTSKDLSMSALSGSIGLGSDSIIQANGGRLIVVAKGTITDNGGNVYYSRATGATGNKGGGMYFGSGITSVAAANSAINAAFGKQAGVVDGFNPTGMDVTDPDGVFWVKIKNGGVVDLAGPPASQAFFDRGAMIFEANGSAANIDLQDASFATDGLYPVSETQSEAAEFVVDTSGD